MHVLDGGVRADDSGSDAARSDVDYQDCQGAYLPFPDRSEAGR